MDGGTLKDYLEDVISERDVLLEELEHAKQELLTYKQHAIHAWFCKEQVCEVCFDHFVIAKYGKEALENGFDD